MLFSREGKGCYEADRTTIHYDKPRRGTIQHCLTPHEEFGQRSHGKRPMAVPP